MILTITKVRKMKMNEFIKNLSDTTIKNVEETHTLLDMVISGVFKKFPEADIRFNQTNVTFEATISDKLSLRITRDVDTGSVLSRVLDRNNVLAECVVDIFGNFSSNYRNIKDVKLKRQIFDWFESQNFIDEVCESNENISMQTSDGTLVEKVSE